MSNINFSTNVTEEALTASPPLRIAGATSYAILCAISMIMNGLLMTVLIQGHRTYKKSSFYIIVWQHITCDQLTQLIQFIVAVPITYAGTPIYGQTWWLYGFSLFDTIAYNGTLYFSFLMTFNRFTVFMWPWLNRILFERPRIYRTIGILWSAIIIFVACLNIFGCHKGFADNGFYYYHICDEHAYAAKTLLSIQGYASTYLPVAMIVAYIAIYLYIKICTSFLSINKNNNETNNKKKDYKLLIQSFLICGFLEVQNIAWSLFPALDLDDQWTYVLNFAQNWISIMNNSINPIVLFIFNSEVRMSLKRIFKKDQILISNNEVPRITRIQSITTNLVGSNGHRNSILVPVANHF